MAWYVYGMSGYHEMWNRENDWVSQWVTDRLTSHGSIIIICVKTYSHEQIQYVITIDVKNINLQIKNIKNMFFQFYKKNIKKHA